MTQLHGQNNEGLLMRGRYEGGYVAGFVLILAGGGTLWQNLKGQSTKMGPTTQGVSVHRAVFEPTHRCLSLPS